MNTESKPPVTLDLTWAGDLRFTGRSRGVEVIVDGDGSAGPSPVQALAFALAGCMATDLVIILKKGRQALSGLHAMLTGHRASEEPRRFISIDLHFIVRGEVAADKVERAIALSREKYCSVWHSLRKDIDFEVTFEIRPHG